MKRYSEQEKDLIEAIHNFQASRGRMQYEWAYRLDIHERVDNLLDGVKVF